MSRRITVVAAVIERGGRVLAAQRGPAGRMPFLWEFPGGKVEPGESHDEALVREIREELQVDVGVGAEILTTEHQYEFALVALTAYFCELLTGEPQLTEHAAMRWLASHELDSVDWAPADLPVVDMVRLAIEDENHSQ